MLRNPQPPNTRLTDGEKVSKKKNKPSLRKRLSILRWGLLADRNRRSLADIGKEDLRHFFWETDTAMGIRNAW